MINQYPDPRNRLVRTMLRWGTGARANILTRLKFIGREDLPKIGEKEADGERMVAEIARLLPPELIWRKC